MRIVPQFCIFRFFLLFRSKTSFKIILKLVMLEGIIAQYLLLKNMPMDTSSIFSLISMPQFSTSTYNVALFT